MRTMEEIQKDYNSQCALLGELTYKLESLAIDKANMISKINELQKEAMAINAEAVPNESES